MPEIVTQPEDLDARWLTEALREFGALPHGRVADVSLCVIGHGKMGDNVRYELTYEGAPDTAPASVVAKLPAADPTARVTSAAQGSYWREVSFYREVAPHIPMRTPVTYLALVADNRADFVILMEDLAPAEPGDQIEGCGPEVAELALREAAKLHAPTAGDAARREAEWVVQTNPEGAAFAEILMKQFWPDFAKRFAHAISPEGAALGERYVASFAKWALGFAGPRTLVHADYRLENMLFATADGGVPIAVVDWQSVGNSYPLVDVAYFLGGGLPTEQRRAHEAELVEIYRRELSASGLDIPPDACWQQYRRATLHGVLITVLGCMLSGQDERGDRMFSAMIERHLQHALDLDAGDFLA